MPQFLLIVFVAALELAGCALPKRPQGQPAGGAYGSGGEILERRPAMPLAPPLGPARRIVQQLTAHWPEREETLLCVLELDERRISMAGLTNEGISLFNLNYDGHDLNLDKTPMLPESVAPEFIVADVQLAFWPAKVLRQMLPEPWRLEADGNRRSLYYGNERRADVDYLSEGGGWPQKVELVNHQYHYRLSIQTISYEVVSE